MNWTPLPKRILVGPTIASIIRINVWAMQLIKLPFPCSNSWNKSRCWEHYQRHHLPFGVKYWVWCNYATIYQLDLCRSPQGGPPDGLSPDLTYHGAHEMRIPPMMNVKVGKCLPQCLWHFHEPVGGARSAILTQYTWYASWHPSHSTMFFQSLGRPHCWHFFDAPRQ